MQIKALEPISGSISITSSVEKKVRWVFLFLLADKSSCFRVPFLRGLLLLQSPLEFMALQPQKKNMVKSRQAHPIKECKRAHDAPQHTSFFFGLFILLGYSGKIRFAARTARLTCCSAIVKEKLV